MIKKFSITPNRSTKGAYQTSNPDFGRIQRAASVLPEGATVSESLHKRANLSSMTNYGMGYGQVQQQYGDGMFHVNRFYDPEVESPDRQYFPRDRLQANKYWRLFYEQDPLIGNAIDMYATMMISDFDIIIQNDTNTQIKNIIADMLEDIQFVQKFKDIVVEFLVLGEAFPHLFFNNSSGLWTYMTLHNPDNMEVIDAPVVNMEPIINFIPDQSTIQLLNDSSTEAREIRESLPPEFLSKVRAGQKIRMKNVNCSYIPRKLHPYDDRGTSIMSRLWRPILVEDAVYASTLATFRRSACFVAGTGVLTKEGVKNIEDVKIGDMVVSGDGNYKEVLNAWEEPPSPTVTIKAAGTEDLVCTPNHKFKVWARPRLCACGCGKELPNTSGGTPRSFCAGHFDFRRDSKTGRFGADCKEWDTYSTIPQIRVLKGYEPIQTVEAKDIKRGDYLLIPKKFEQNNTEVNERTKALARLLGYYAAEGSRRKRYGKEEGVTYEREDSGITFTFSLAERETWAEDVVGLASILELDTRIYIKKPYDGREGNTSVFIDRVRDSWFAEWCYDNAGILSNTKKLSKEVMEWPLELKREFIIGLFRGDGHSRKSGEAVDHGTTSRSLAYQVRLLLAQLGIFASINVQRRSNESNWSDCYHVIICGEGNRYLSELVWGKVIDFEGKKTHSWCWQDEDYIYVLVRNVKDNKVLVPVYNITVEGDHSYIAQGVQSFNSPLKVVKFGNPQTAWIPDPSEWQNLLSLLVSAEQDPQAWIATHYGVNFEAWGANERSVTISKEHDTIEKIKLMALGMSKAFISGDAAFASAKSGLQVFLRRLLSLRQFFEAIWVYPKLINPICEINGWSKSSPSEVAHNFRVKRGQEEVSEAGLSIRPRIRWKNKLDPMVDSDMLQAYQQLRNLGFPISKDTIGTSVYLNWENELEKDAREFKERSELLERTVGTKWKNLYEQEQKKSAPAAKPAGAPGSGAMPPGAQGKPPAKPMDDASRPPGSAPGSMPNAPVSEGIESPSGGGVPEGI